MAEAAGDGVADCSAPTAAVIVLDPALLSSPGSPSSARAIRLATMPRRDQRVLSPRRADIALGQPRIIRHRPKHNAQTEDRSPRLRQKAPRIIQHLPRHLHRLRHLVRRQFQDERWRRPLQQRSLKDPRRPRRRDDAQCVQRAA